MDRHFKDFLSRTTLHGFKYLGQKRRKRVEKIFWSIAFGISIILTVIMIYKLLQNYYNSPIVIVADNFDYWISDFHFPSVTICPSLMFNTKFVKTVDYNSITKALVLKQIAIENLTMEE